MVGPDESACLGSDCEICVTLLLVVRWRDRSGMAFNHVTNRFSRWDASNLLGEVHTKR